MLQAFLRPTPKRRSEATQSKSAAIDYDRVFAVAFAEIIEVRIDYGEENSRRAHRKRIGCCSLLSLPKR